MIGRVGQLRQFVSRPSFVLVILALSSIVAGVIAAQAIVAARQRQAISETMLRQYARLAALEFARQSRGAANQSLQAALNRYAHPHSRDQHDEIPLSLDEWIVVTPDGAIRSTKAIELAPHVRDAVSRAIGSMAGGGHAEGVRLVPILGDPQHVISVKPEPHLAEGAGFVAFVTPVQAFAPVFAATHKRASLLPALLTGEAEGTSLVHLRVTDDVGGVVFASPATVEGPEVVRVPVWPEDDMALTVHASMTPAFIAGLQFDYGSGANVSLVLILVAVNATLIVAAAWQIRRERELAQLRSNFIAGVSHELRTPLAQIRMFSETLILERVRNETERARALQIISQESVRLSQLVDNVLQFHRGTLAPANAAGTTIDLSAFTNDVLESFAPLAASKRARIEFEPLPDGAKVHGDTGNLRQVLLNVLDNAVKYGPPDQTVTVAVGATASKARLTIEDSGPGVPLAERVRIFNPFERGRDTRGAGGAGIGLAVVKQVLDAHGGDIRVEDAPRGGARFVIELPRADAIDGSHQPGSGS